MRLRQKAPAAIRRDALQMATRKFSEGCHECGQAYLDLAKEQGATSEELADAAEWTRRRVSRRDLFRAGAVGAASVALGSRIFDPLSAFASTTYYWGTDTNTKSCSKIPQNFYLGHAGGGVTENWTNFNFSAARAAGPNYSFMYWDLVGPGLTPAGKTDYQWGQMQSQKARSVKLNSANAQYTYCSPIFADIESGNSGSWGSHTGARDQNVLRGWLDDMKPWFSPGIYISLNNWVSFFGTGFRPSTSFVLWLTGCRTSATCNPGSGSTCACDPRSSAQSLWASHPSATILGGCKTVMWQYYIGPDYDLTTQNPEYVLVPVTSSTTYHNGC